MPKSEIRTWLRMVPTDLDDFCFEQDGTGVTVFAMTLGLPYRLSADRIAMPFSDQPCQSVMFRTAGLVSVFQVSRISCNT